MNRFPHPFLLCSITIFLFLSCQPYKLVQEEKQQSYSVSSPLHINTGDNAIYKASIRLFNNDLSGLFVMVNADSLYKVGFLSEMGIKFFDMIIAQNSYEVVYCMEALDRKPVLNAIARSLRFILEDPAKHDGDYYADKDNNIIYKSDGNDRWKRKYYLENNRIEKIKGRRFIRNRLFINLSYNNNKQPENIIFLQRGMRMRIEMTKLQTEVDSRDKH